jgi:hypothetical protein
MFYRQSSVGSIGMCEFFLAVCGRQFVSARTGGKLGDNKGFDECEFVESSAESNRSI